MNYFLFIVETKNNNNKRLYNGELGVRQAGHRLRDF